MTNLSARKNGFETRFCDKLVQGIGSGRRKCVLPRSLFVDLTRNSRCLKMLAVRSAAAGIATTLLI